MHQQAKLPEIFDQIPQNTPTPGNEILPRVQVWPYPEHPPPHKIENSNFLSRVQVQPYPEHPSPARKLKTLTFFLDSKSDLTQNIPQGRLKYVETNGCIPKGYHLVSLFVYVSRYTDWIYGKRYFLRNLNFLTNGRVTPEPMFS